jgi:hypothetical protein
MGLAGGIASCCANGLCPMHKLAEIHCDMDLGGKQAQLQPCPDLGPHYGAALIFVRVAALAVAGFSAASEPLAVPQSSSAPAVEADVAAPPPRSVIP